MNTYGAFYCNCSLGFEGQLCGASRDEEGDMQVTAPRRIIQRNLSVCNRRACILMVLRLDVLVGSLKGHG